MRNRGRAALPAPRKDAKEIWALAPVVAARLATPYPQQNQAGVRSPAVNIQAPNIFVIWQ